MNYKIVVLLFLITKSLIGQLDTYLPVYANQNLLLNPKGKEVLTLPAGFGIINTEKGKHSSGWRLGMANADIGNCNMIAAVDKSSYQHKLFDLEGRVKRLLPQNIKAISPCYDNYFIAQSNTGSSIVNTTKYIYYDGLGNQVFDPFGYTKAGRFSEGLAPVLSPGIGWRYINDLGHELDIIPDTFKNIQEVGPFYNGLSKVVLRSKKVGFSYSKKVYFIDKKGDIILDLNDIIPNKSIVRCANFKFGICLIEFYKEGKGYHGSDIAYINRKGEILYQAINGESFRPPKGPFIGLMKFVKDVPYTCHLFDKEGNTIPLPKNSKSIYHINDSYFYLRVEDDDGNSQSHVYDAKEGKTIFPIDSAVVMSVKGNLISFHRKKTNKHYVIDYTTGELVYSNKLSEQIVRNLASFKGDFGEIRHIRCNDLASLNKVHKCKNLVTLTIKNISTHQVPDLSKLTKLHTLRLDNCRGITQIPTGISSIKKLSIRNCISISNIRASIKELSGLKLLNVINADMSKEDRRFLRQKFPEGTISGNAEDINNELQIVIENYE